MLVPRCASEVPEEYTVSSQSRQCFRGGHGTTLALPWPDMLPTIPSNNSAQNVGVAHLLKLIRDIWNCEVALMLFDPNARRGSYWTGIHAGIIA